MSLLFAQRSNPNMRPPIDDDQNSRGDEEESPLLPKVSTPSSQQEDKVLKEAKAEEISSNKLKWIMTSVWIGTFCAGLGEHCASLLLLTTDSVSAARHSERLLLTMIRWNTHCHPGFINCHRISHSAPSRMACNCVSGRNCGNSAIGRETNRHLFPTERSLALQPFLCYR